MSAWWLLAAFALGVFVGFLLGVSMWAIYVADGIRATRKAQSQESKP